MSYKDPLRGKELESWLDRAVRVRDCSYYGRVGHRIIIIDGYGGDENEWPQDLDGCPQCRQTMKDHIDACVLCYLREEAEYGYSRSVASSQGTDDGLSVADPEDQD